MFLSLCLSGSLFFCLSVSVISIRPPNPLPPSLSHTRSSINMYSQPTFLLFPSLSLSSYPHILKFYTTCWLAWSPHASRKYTLSRANLLLPAYLLGGLKWLVFFLPLPRQPLPQSGPPPGTSCSNWPELSQLHMYGAPFSLPSSLPPSLSEPPPMPPGDWTEHKPEHRGGGSVLGALTRWCPRGPGCKAVSCRDL